jgi:hypothetical protein
MPFSFEAGGVADEGTQLNVLIVLLRKTTESSRNNGSEDCGGPAYAVRCDSGGLKTKSACHPNPGRMAMGKLPRVIVSAFRAGGLVRYLRHDNRSYLQTERLLATRGGRVGSAAKKCETL